MKTGFGKDKEITGGEDEGTVLSTGENAGFEREKRTNFLEAESLGDLFVMIVQVGTIIDSSKRNYPPAMIINSILNGNMNDVTRTNNLRAAAMKLKGLSGWENFIISN